MTKLLAISALLFSTSLFANPFVGKYKSDACVEKDNLFYQTEIEIIAGDLDHYGEMKETVAEYLDEDCEIDTELRKTYEFDYTLYPMSKKGIYEFNVYKKNEEKISFFDIITKGKYKGKKYIFFGKGGPAKVERRRPVSRDLNRRFRKVKG